MMEVSVPLEDDHRVTFPPKLWWELDFTKMGNLSPYLVIRVYKISNWIDKKVGYIHNLRESQALVTTMEELKAKRDDLSRRVTREEEDRRQQRLAEIESLRSSYRYGKKVFLTLKEVEELRSIVFQKVTDQAESAVIEEIQPQQIIVGQEAMLKEGMETSQGR
ncbi:unnamed protein product [Microthlaspi erraticum]|uniref:Uncharacterized protein n=1 Tax=Microthlaspi erraticum TaxID=1685480 RepID=A0A6D2I710_9BRAS|nr:unnamed protein product [Microthlaspi erraticum]